MTQLNIRQVEVFKAVMEAGSVTGAAKLLNLAQPSVTKHLRNLERTLAMLLFQRSRNRLIPTPEGRAFHDQIERTYLGLDHLSRFADDLRNDRQGEILLAAMPLIAHSWLPEIVADFLARHPDVSMSLPVRSSRWIADWVAAGRVDFGIGLAMDDARGIRQELLMKVPLVCAFPAAHRLARQRRVAAADLSGDSLISFSNFDHWRLTVETALKEQHIVPRRRIDTFTTYTACDLVSRGVGVAVVDIVTAMKYAGDALAWRPFEPRLTFDIHLMQARHWQVPRIAGTFIAFLKEKAAATGRAFPASPDT